MKLKRGGLYILKNGDVVEITYAMNGVFRGHTANGVYHSAWRADGTEYSGPGVYDIACEAPTAIYAERFSNALRELGISMLGCIPGMKRTAAQMRELTTITTNISEQTKGAKK